MPRLSTQLILVLAIVILGAIIVFAGPAACQKIRSMGAQSKVDHAQSGAFHNSAADAVTNQSEVNQRQADSEALTRSNERDIRNAPGANDAVNPALRDTGFASLCKRPSFRNSPTGRVRCAPAS